MRYGIKDRVVDLARNIAERLSLTKESLIHIGLAVVLAIGISASIAVGVSPDARAIMDDLYWLSQTDEEILDALGGLDADTASAIGGINSTVLSQVASIDDLTFLLNGLQADFNNLVCSPPNAHLEGSFRDYTLYVKSNEAGQFTANVHLVYSPPISAGNATNYTAAVDCFYSGINWTLANYLYIPTVSFNGTAWGIPKVSFSIATFTLEAHTRHTVDITVAGLSPKPEFIYVEVHPVLE